MFLFVLEDGVEPEPAQTAWSRMDVKVAERGITKATSTGDL
jgi:hypothetical protein